MNIIKKIKILDKIKKSLNDPVVCTAIMCSLSILCSIIIMSIVKWLYYEKDDYHVYFLCLLLNFILVIPIMIILSIFKKIIKEKIQKVLRKVEISEKEFIINYLKNENDKDFLMYVSNLSLSMKKIMLLDKELLNRLYKNEGNKNLYLMFEDFIKESVKNKSDDIYDPIAYLFYNIETNDIIEIKNYLFLKYKKESKETTIKNILEKKEMNKFEMMCNLSYQSIDNIMEHKELIQESYSENILIILDLFGLMSINGKLKCLKNENFNVYLKKIEKISKEKYSLTDIYNKYFKDLCDIIKNEELKEYYSTISYLFSDINMEEVEILKYRASISNTSEIHKNAIINI